MSDGFLGRWSKRKLDAQEGKPLVEEQPLQPTGAAAPAAAGGAQPAPTPDAPPEAPLPLTLEDVRALNSESDFGPFAGRGVAPDVQHAAMKKLFSDPHYNVMDRLDTYIDDYSQPDPIPAAMLRQLASAKFLGLFDQEERDEEAARQAALKDNENEPAPAPAIDPAREVADNPTTQTVAQSAPAPAVPSAHPHDHPDMRLQPDDAPPGEKPGGSAE